MLVNSLGVHQLQAEVEYAKHEHKWEEQFMILQEKLDYARAEGMKQGKAEGIAEGIEKTLIGLVSKGVLTVEQAAEQAGLPIEEFQKLLKKN
ncbi:MAG: hypothetical protein KBS79_02250 [Lachnospiraceae bacterium]|nr:hypothetical protein [Candidatus Minthocola equi]